MMEPGILVTRAVRARRSWHQRAALLAVAVLAASLSVGATGARAETPALEDILSAVVLVRADVPAEARTARTLGTRREGSGVVIDDDGLVLTIGYLILESSGAVIVRGDGKAVPAHFVAYDHDSGFGLLRAGAPLGVKALQIGDSSSLRVRHQVLVASHGGPSAAIGAFVTSRRPFAGYWEYLLENAIFTAPPHASFGGAALIGSDGKLVGIGSLFVPDAMEPNVNFPGNMFVPIDLLKPILADLLSRGRSSAGPRPWIGLYSQELHGRLLVSRVAPGGPAAAAGVKRGDLVLSVGGKTVDGLADFYRKMWAVGKAGVTVPLTVLRGNAPMKVDIESIDRYDWLRMKLSY